MVLFETPLSVLCLKDENAFYDVSLFRQSISIVKQVFHLSYTWLEIFSNGGLVQAHNLGELVFHNNWCCHYGYFQNNQTQLLLLIVMAQSRRFFQQSFIIVMEISTVNLYFQTKFLQCDN